MPITTKTIYIDVAKEATVTPVYAKQDDTASRYINITLEDGGEQIIIAPTSTITLNAEKPDGTHTVTLGTVNEDGTVTVELTNQTLAVDGTVRCDIVIIDTDGRKLTTATLYVEVERAAVDDDTIASTDDYSALVEAFTAAQDARDAAEEYAGQAYTSEVSAAESAQQASNSMLNGITTHNSDPASHPSILSSLVTVEAIARGKSAAKAFATIAAMTAWLAVPGNADTLSIGDNLYIEDISVPDYWWDGSAPAELEANILNLTDYYTKAEVDARLPIIIEQSDYDALVTAGTVIAGRIYYVVPDGTLGA